MSDLQTFFAWDETRSYLRPEEIRLAYQRVATAVDVDWSRML